MVNIPAGEVVLRDDRIKKEWLVQIQPFLLAKYAVTIKLYDAITNSPLNNFDKNHKPVVNISWNDAIAFCNVLSKKAGLKEYYSIFYICRSVINIKLYMKKVSILNDIDTFLL